MNIGVWWAETAIKYSVVDWLYTWPMGGFIKVRLCVLKEIAGMVCL